jgi:lactoylglutathione lyase
MDVIHTAIWVSDLDATSEFYEDVLGLTYDRQFELDGVTNYYVGSDADAELQFKYDPDEETTVEPSGVDHLAVGVDDVDAEFERIVEACDPPVVTEPTTIEQANARVAFIEDPDGYVVELVEAL